MLPRLTLGPVALLLSLAFLGSVSAQEAPRPSAEAGLPPGIEAEFLHLERTGDDEVVLTGDVTIRWGKARFQADRMTFREQRFVEAAGNVLIVWGDNRIFGTRMSYDLDLDRGTIENAIGQIAEDFIFWAKLVEKVGEDTVHIKRGRVTTCTQPTPYWSFLVSSATIQVEAYARMWNVVLKAWKLPIFYLPYLVWPVKRERAAGLLFPQFGNTSQRGRFYSQDVFVPLGKSADLTLQGRYYAKAGFAFGTEARFIPNRDGAGTFSGFVIDDQVTKKQFPERSSLRYALSYRQTQQFKNGFRMVADINTVSDFDFFTDYARDLELVSTPTIQTRVEFSRNGPSTSMNARELRREQLLANQSSLVQQTLPEIEWRGRSRRMARSPVYLAYEASFASIQQRGAQFGQSIDADYMRGDLFPTITVPWSPAPWIDINPQVAYRFTYYTQRQQEVLQPDGTSDTIEVDESLARNLWRAGVDIIGPKIYRIYGGGDKGRPTYKHSFEPQVSYFAGNEFEDQTDIISFDDVDTFSVAGNRVSYALVTRLFAKRARSRAEPRAYTETVLLPDGTRSTPGGGAALPGAPIALPEGPGEDDSAPQEAVEMASLELRQSRAFDRDLSSADKDGDGQTDDTSQFSSLQLIGRYNPSPTTSVDLRSSFNVLFNEFSDFTVSGTVRRQLAQVRFSLVHRNGLGLRTDNSTGQPILVPNANDTQLRLTTGFNLLRDRLQLYVDGTYDADPPSGRTHLPNMRWRVIYRTQCCTFFVERLIRDFQATSDRQDWYFRIDLKGVGKLLDFKY